MVTSTVVSEQNIRTVELKVTGAPPHKWDYVYYDITGLRAIYQDDTLISLTLVGVPHGGTDEPETIGTRLDLYDMIQPWIRDLVEEHRPRV